MSKRYGRNQKRRHREEIAVLKSDNERIKYNLENEMRVRSYLEQQAAAIVDSIESVCENSSCLPPKEYCGREKGKKNMRLVIRGKPLYFAEMYVPEVSKQGFVDVASLDVYIQEHKEEMAQSVHLVYGDNEGHSAYMLSKNALHHMPSREIENRIAPVVAAELLNFLRSETRR